MQKLVFFNNPVLKQPLLLPKKHSVNGTRQGADSTDERVWVETSLS